MKQNNNYRITIEELMNQLGINFVNGKKKRLEYLVDKIYQAGILSPKDVVETVRKILMADPDLSAIDDIYIYNVYGRPRIDFKYTFWPKKYIEYGVFETVDAFLVREDDDFKVNIDNNETKIIHNFNPFSGKPIIGAYARGIRKDGKTIIALATKEELDMAYQAAKEKNKGKKTAWDNWYDELAKKVPIKRLVKLVPTPAELQNALNFDNEIYDLSKASDIKNNQKIKAVEDFNEQLDDGKVSLLDALPSLGIKFDIKAGYIKVDKKYLDEENACMLGLCKESKDKTGWVGLANQKVDKDTLSKVIVSIPEEDKEQEKGDDNE